MRYTVFACVIWRTCIDFGCFDVARRTATLQRPASTSFLNENENIDFDGSRQGADFGSSEMFFRIRNWVIWRSFSITKVDVDWKCSEKERGRGKTCDVIHHIIRGLEQWTRNVTTPEHSCNGITPLCESIPHTQSGENKVEGRDYRIERFSRPSLFTQSPSPFQNNGSLSSLFVHPIDVKCSMGKTSIHLMKKNKFKY